MAWPLVPPTGKTSRSHRTPGRAAAQPTRPAPYRARHRGRPRGVVVRLLDQALPFGGLPTRVVAGLRPAATNLTSVLADQGDLDGRRSGCRLALGGPYPGPRDTAGRVTPEDKWPD
jgi:hypothetical protein